MIKLIKIEKALFYFFIAAAFWQWRLVSLPELSSALPRAESFNEWTAFFLYATDAILAAVFILWGARLKPDFGLSLKSGFNRFANIALFFFLIFSALSIFVAQDKAIAFFRFIKLLEFAGLYLYLRYNFTALYNLKRFWQWFIAGAALQSIVALAQFFTQKSLGLKFFAESPIAPNIDGVAKIVVGGAKIVRAYGLVPHPNILAAILTVAIFGLAWLFLSGQKTKKTVFLFGAVFILLSAALFVTFSRGVIIVGGIVFLIWLAYLWRQKEGRRTIIGILLLFAIGYSLLAIIYWPYVSSRFDLAAIGSSQALNLRQFYNQAALDLIKEEPLLGVGLGNFVPRLADIYNKLQPWVWQPAHNIYLLIAVETGVFASLAFLAFLFLTIKNACPRRRDLSVSCFLSVICCLLFVGLFDHFLWDLQQGQILFWLMLGLLSSTSLRSSAD